MKNASRAVAMAILSVLVLSLFSVGCTKHPNAEQLQALEEQKQAALAAESTLQEKRSEKNRLQSELDKKRRELQETKQELEEVKRRLGQ